MKNKVLLLMFFCLLVFPFISADGIYNTQNISKNYSTIQDAINNASDGNTIIVSAGTYNENIIINKSLILLGAQNGTDARTRTGSESIISSNDILGTVKIGPTNGTVVIDGFNITSSPNPQGGAIFVSDLSEQVDIRNNIIEYSTADGILMYYAKKGTIEKNYIKGTQLSGITGGQSDRSPSLKSQLTIKNNKIVNSKYGITGYLDHSTISNNEIIGNPLTPDSAGIGGQFYNTLIELNNISNYQSGAGIAFQDYLSRGTLGVNVKNNIITNNYAGIFVNQTIAGKSINISHNSIFGNLLYGAINLNTSNLSAEYNYWGSCDGPGLVGPGNGDNISTNVDYAPWIGVCVQNQTISNNCIIENESFILNTEISGNCISNVIFSVLKNSLWTNYSSSSHIENNYSLNLANLSSSHFEWKVYTADCLNNVNESPIKNFYVYPHTTLTINPSIPEGKNGWYLTNPVFSLTNTNASNISYRWDSQEILHSTPFGFENAPNNQDVTGGIIDLNYWSGLSCGRIESEQNKIIKVDLTAPEIINLAPSNNSTTHEIRPKIYAFLRDKINGDSGINISSLIFKINENIIPNLNLNITNKSDFNYEIRYSPSFELLNGYNNISINVSDYAGRSTKVSWRFNVEKINNSFELKVYSPVNGIYGSTKILFNITTDKKVNLIEYIDWNGGKRWTKLCTDCDNYGNFSKKTKTLTEGQHNLTIRASNELETREKNISFIVDSKIPRIYKTEPRTNQFTDGSNFYIRFSEDNPLELLLFINNSLNKYTINLSKCTRVGVYTDCYYDVDLTSFEGKTIPYWFVLKDIANHTSLLKKTLVKVDTESPQIDIISPQNDATYVRNVPFSILVNEANFDSVSYTYIYNGKEREVLLCSTLKNNYCNKTKSFSPGDYSITIKVEDKGGKVLGINREFKII